VITEVSFFGATVLWKALEYAAHVAKKQRQIFEFPLPYSQSKHSAAKTHKNPDAETRKMDN
jgi:hypothetical protein